VSFHLSACNNPVQYCMCHDSMLISKCSCTQVPLLASERISPTQVTADNQYDILAGVVTPLWQVPYQEQLDIKWKWSQHVLENFIKKLRDRTKGKKVKKISYRLHQVKPSVSGLYRFVYSELNRKTIIPLCRVFLVLLIFSCSRNCLMFWNL
jgi:hypothetical protein